MSKAFLTSLADILKVSRESPILINSEDGEVSVGTYSSYHSVILSCKAELEDFRVVVSNEIARQLQRSLTAENLSLTVSGATLNASSKGMRTKVATLNESLTVKKLLNKFSEVETHRLDGSRLNEAVNMVKSSANDKSIGDIVLRGYHMYTHDNNLELMASNGSVLTSVALPCESELVDTTVLPNPEFHQITSLLSGEVSLRQETDTLSIFGQDGDRTLHAVTSFTSGKPVPYRQVMQQVSQNEIRFKVINREFLEALKRVAFFVDERGRVELKLTEGKLLLTSTNTQGMSTSAVDIDIDTDEEMTMVTGYSNLYGYFNSTSAVLTEFRISDEKSPIYITDGTIHRVSVLYIN